MTDDEAPGTERALTQAITDLLEQRAAGATLCPSEAARVVHAASRPDRVDWPWNPGRWRCVPDL